jgi:hypothetical protein
VITPALTVPKPPEPTTLRELQLVLNALPSLIKALPILAAYLVVMRFSIGQVRAWKQPVAGQELAYALVGLAAILWALGR